MKNVIVKIFNNLQKRETKRLEREAQRLTAKWCNDRNYERLNFTSDGHLTIRR